MGVLAETLRLHPAARRSSIPSSRLPVFKWMQPWTARRWRNPLAPIAALADQEGWVIAGVDHTVNTSFHFAERQAGRKQFVRWALTPAGLAECQAFRAAPDGFEDAAPILEEITRRVKLGDCEMRPSHPAHAGDCWRPSAQGPAGAALQPGWRCGRCDAVRQSLSALHSEGP